MTSPASGVINITSPYKWALDNGVFTDKFDPARFATHLKKLLPHQDRCLFITAPDIVGNANKTLELYAHWYPVIKQDGWPIAYVAQDGSENLPIPDCDYLFVGGTTHWKWSRETLTLIGRAKDKGIRIHAGRVNSQKAIKHWQLAGAYSVDGTSPAFSPNRTYKRFEKQLIQDPLCY